MRRMTSDATFGFQWSVFVGERSLLIGVALDAGSICPGS